MSLNSQIADLILERGRAQAQGEAASGAAWGGALSQIGQNVGRTIAALPAIKAEAARVGDEQRARDARLALSEAMKPENVPHLEQEGLKLSDVQGIGNFMAKKGFGAEFVPAAPHIDALNKSLIDLQQARMGVVKSGALGLLAADAPPELVNNFLNQLETNQVYSPATVQSYRDFTRDHPDQIKTLLRSIAGPQKATVLHQGDVGFDETNAPIQGMAVAPKPVAPTKASLATEAAGGDPAKALELLTPPAKPANAQSESFLLDGKAVKGAFVPDDKGGKYIYNGEDVTSRAKPIPPAAVQVQNVIAGQTLPTWALDGSRPSKEEGNKFDSKVGMTPNGLFQSAQDYVQTGKFPPTARGSNPRADAIRSAVQSKAGAIAADAGMDIPTLRAFYKSNAASLGQQQKMYDAVQGFMATADKNAELLEASLKKIPDIGIPIFNKPLRTFEKDVAGDANLSQFGTYLKSVQNEYARIISQPNLAGQLTDSARTEAEHLLDPKATIPQMVASIQALKNEGNNRLTSVGEQIQRIQSRMSGSTAAPAPTTQAATPTPAAPSVPSNVAAALKGASVGKHTLSDGSVWVIGRDGSITKGS